MADNWLAPRYVDNWRPASERRDVRDGMPAEDELSSKRATFCCEQNDQDVHSIYTVYTSRKWKYTYHIHIIYISYTDYTVYDVAFLFLRRNIQKGPSFSSFVQDLELTKMKDAGLIPWLGFSRPLKWKTQKWKTCSNSKLFKPISAGSRDPKNHSEVLFSHQQHHPTSHWRPLCLEDSNAVTRHQKKAQHGGVPAHSLYTHIQVYI